MPSCISMISDCPHYRLFLLLYDISDMSLSRQLFSRLNHQLGRRSLSLSSTTQKPDQATHTGQQFSEADPRNVRFAVTGLQKQVNSKWAIDLIAEVPPIRVNKRIVSVSSRHTTCSSVLMFRFPVTEVVELWATPRSTSTWTMGSPSLASTADSDTSSTPTRMIMWRSTDLSPVNIPRKRRNED